MPVSRNRMVDTQPTELYEDLRNTASNEWITQEGNYSGSEEALALKMAFALGADTSAQFPSHDKLVSALLAGRKWGLTQKSSRRLVAVGKFIPGFTTMELSIDVGQDADTVAAAGLPQWSPDRLGPDEPDHDLLRKQRIEDEL